MKTLALETRHVACRKVSQKSKGMFQEKAKIITSFTVWYKNNYFYFQLLSHHSHLFSLWHAHSYCHFSPAVCFTNNTSCFTHSHNYCQSTLISCDTFVCASVYALNVLVTPSLPGLPTSPLSTPSHALINDSVITLMCPGGENTFFFLLQMPGWEVDGSGGSTEVQKYCVSHQPLTCASF